MNEPSFHQFAERLAFSVSPDVDDFIQEVYRRAFPDAVQIEDCTKGMHFQKVGIDRRVHLPCGRKVKIDEKVREVSYNDILLEYVSVSTTGAKGWIEKDLGIDYVLYAFLSTRRAYFLPFDLLRRAWAVHKETWIAYGEAKQRGFRHVVAQNNGYETHSIAVPTGTLITALIESLTISL